SAAPDAVATETGSDSGSVDAKGDGEAGEAPFDNPSCAGLPPTCGPTNNQDCCDRATIPGGAFLRSYDGAGFTDPSFGATLSSFGLDTFEVSVGRFRMFVQAGFGTQVNPPAAGSGGVAGTPNSGWSPGDNANLAADAAALATGLQCSAA